MKNLQGLLAFVETVATGSLTAAAERLNVSPAAVSKNLAQLERQLGVRLLNRSTRKLSITSEGQRLLHNAQTALLLLDEAVADVSSSANSPIGKVRISVGGGFGRRWVLPVLPLLSNKYPNLQIDLDLNNHTVGLVSEGYDIGIRGGQVPDSNMIVRRICKLHVALFASPAYLRERGIPNTPSQLLQHSCITPRFGKGMQAPWRFKESNGPCSEFSPKPVLTTTDPEVVLDFALENAGIVQASLLQGLPHLQSGRLKLVMPELLDVGEREFFMCYPHRLYMAPRVRVVVDALMAHFEKSEELHLSLEDICHRIPDCVAREVLINSLS